MGAVISLCDRTGNMVQPWLDAGFDAITVDLQEQENPHPRRRHIVGDVTQLGPHFASNHGAAIVFAFPPCTHFAVSGARWMKDKGLEALAGALSIVAACKSIVDHSSAPWMLENPIGTLATYWREPDFYFDPNEYGDPYTKRTCIWCGNGFVMPPKVMPGDMFSEPTWVEPTLGSMMHRMWGGTDGSNKRSVTPMGFARAVFMANAPSLMQEAAE